MTSGTTARRASFHATIGRVLPLLVLGLAWLWPRHSSADQVADSDARIVSYTTPQEAHYWRMTLEELAILGAGIGQYWYDRNSNSRDWQFKYDWPSFEARIEGRAYAFDTNGFDTNFLFHPTAGSLYYLSARSNHLNAVESLLVAFTASSLWEFFGEFQEKISINDVVVTPLTGMAWGETTTELGAYFMRACPSTANDIFGTTLAPLTALHDAADGATRIHSDCNPDSASAHRFRLSLSGGEAQTAGLTPYPFLRLSVQAEVIHLPGFARPGTGWSTFSDGNVSRFALSTSFAGPHSPTVTDVTLITQTVLTGVHYRHNFFEASELHRSEALFGLLIGAEYGRHRYDPDAAPDRIFLIDVPALTTRWYGRTRDLGWELTLDAGGTFGGVDSFALSRALELGQALTDLTSVAQGEGYNHVVGLALAPRARIDLGAAEIGIDLRSDRMLAWRLFDRSNVVSHTAVTEQRRRGSLWISVGAPGVERFTLSTNWTRRSGSVGDVRVGRTELSLNAGVELAL